jgi:hypothetical protein
LRLCSNIAIVPHLLCHISPAQRTAVGGTCQMITRSPSAVSSVRHWFIAEMSLDLSRIQPALARLGLIHLRDLLDSSSGMRSYRALVVRDARGAWRQLRQAAGFEAISMSVTIYPITPCFLIRSRSFCAARADTRPRRASSKTLKRPMPFRSRATLPNGLT